MLQEAGIPTRWQLLRDYPAREFAAQYEESDYKFRRRLLAEEGIYFYFPEGPELDAGAAGDALVPGETVVFGDDATSYPAMAVDDPSALASGPSAAAVAVAVSDAPPLYFLATHDTSTSRTDKIMRFVARTTVRASSASFRDYDPDRPMARPSSAATSTQPFPAVDPATTDPDGGTGRGAGPRGVRAPRAVPLPQMGLHRRRGCARAAAEAAPRLHRQG